eukprot:538215-Pelagomonas_calceolata.AAC.1
MQVPVGKEVCMQSVVGVECTGKGVGSTGVLHSPSTPVLQPSHRTACPFVGDVLVAMISTPGYL